MIGILLGVFFVLHGLVHLLYAGQSLRIFELQPGMYWPDGALAFSKLLEVSTTRTLGSVLLVLAALGFVIGGTGVIFKQAWWRPMIVGVAVFSTFIYLLLWDGGLQNLDDKGMIGVLINLAVLAALLVLRWPAFDF